jgi:hypothetical protein
METWHVIPTTQQNQDTDWLLLVKTIIRLNHQGFILSRQNYRGIKIKLQNLNLGYNDGEVAIARAVYIAKNYCRGNNHE